MPTVPAWLKSVPTLPRAREHVGADGAAPGVRGPQVSVDLGRACDRRLGADGSSAEEGRQGGRPPRQVSGIRAALGRELEVDATGGKQLTLEVIGFRDGKLLAAPLGPTSGIAPGAGAPPHERASAEVGGRSLGRVIDAFGRPLDHRPMACRGRAPLHANPPPAAVRAPADRYGARHGIRAIDSLLAFGEGQRIGLFAGTGVGKSTLLGMLLCRHADADVIVAALIGERGREVGDFVRHAIGEESMRRCVVVAATSDAPPLVRVRALRATSIASTSGRREARPPRDGLPSLATRWRSEASLAAGEPPLRRRLHADRVRGAAAAARACPRDANSGRLHHRPCIFRARRGDDMNDPIADTVRASSWSHRPHAQTGGQEPPSRHRRAEERETRVARDVSTKEHTAAASLRELLAAYEGGGRPLADRRVRAWLQQTLTPARLEPRISRSCVKRLTRLRHKEPDDRAFARHCRPIDETKPR